MKRVKIKDKVFEQLISQEEIEQAIKRIATEMNRNFIGKNPVFIGVLNGCFFFAADLLKQINLDCEISFVKLASYDGMHSTGSVRQLLGLDQEVHHRHVVVLEDVVDTGVTLESILQILENMGASSISVASLLFKKEAYQKSVPLDFVGFEINKEFVIGYGLDYDGMGRNLNEIYVHSNESSIKKDTEMLNIVLFGPPGAGKGTQAEYIKNKYKLVHLSTGDLLREQKNEGTELGLLAHSYMSKGELVPDEVVIGMIGSKLSQHKDSNGFIFDGFPRTTAQAKALDELLQLHQTEIDIMLSLEVDDEELVARIIQRGKSSGREDDKNESVIYNRIITYNKKTAPLKDYYSKQNKYASVKGVGSIENVFKRLCDKIDELNKSQA